MTTHSDALIPLLTFCWGEEPYAVPLATVREVARPGRITPVPGGSASLVGAIVLHGDILPVADVRGLLGLPPDPERMSDACVIVIKRQNSLNEPVGLLVDRIHEVRHAPADAIGDRELTPDRRPSTPRLLAGQVRAEDGSLINVLDVPQVLAAL